MRMMLTAKFDAFAGVRIYLDGTMIAESGVFRRRRSFDNRLTGRSVWAPDCTRLKIEANPAMIVKLLVDTGTVLADPRVEVD